MRDLVRARAFAKEDVRRARQRLASFLLKHGVDLPTGVRRWSKTFQRWLDGVSFAHRPSQIAFEEYRYAEREMVRRLERLEAEIHTWATEGEHAPVIQALQALKGVREVTAVTLVAEVGQFSRFRSPAQLMAYARLRRLRIPLPVRSPAPRCVERTSGRRSPGGKHLCVM